MSKMKPLEHCEFASCEDPEGPFGKVRNFLGQSFIYVVISPRAKGLSIGINMNPDGQCNFDCSYCEVDRQRLLLKSWLNLDAMSRSLMRLWLLYGLTRFDCIRFWEACG